jgi:hypothetical protein
MMRPGWRTSRPATLFALLYIHGKHALEPLRPRHRVGLYIGDGRNRPESGFDGQIAKFSIVEPKFSITQHMFRWASGDGS